MVDYRTIILKGDGIRKENKAGGAITPGMLVMFASDGDMEVHGTAGGNATPMFALEQDFFGKDIDDAYAANDLVQYTVACTGVEIAALVKGAEAAIKKGDYLQSKGDGTLTKYTAAEIGGSAVYTPVYKRVVAQAMEDIDVSGDANTTKSRIRVQVV